AEAHRDAVLAQERAAADAAREAREKHAAAAARAGGDGVSVLEERLAAAETALAAATEAGRQHDLLAVERAQLAELDAEAEAARVAFGDALNEARTRVAALAAGIGESRAAVDAARGTHVSVAERVAEATRLRDAA